MENNEVLENEKVESTEMVETRASNVMSFEDLNNNSNTHCDIITNITDKKQLFNLESNVDELLNDCEGEKIRVKGVLIKRYERMLKDPIFNEETGEILKDKEITMSCVLVDDNDKSYATGSKSFAIQLMRYLQNYGTEELKEGLEIEITKKKIKNSNNKALSFKLV